MCLEDIRIERATRFTAYSADSESSFNIPADPSRTAITLSVSPAGQGSLNALITDAADGTQREFRLATVQNPDPGAVLPIVGPSQWTIDLNTHSAPLITGPLILRALSARAYAICVSLSPANERSLQVLNLPV